MSLRAPFRPGSANDAQNQRQQLGHQPAQTQDPVAAKANAPDALNLAPNPPLNISSLKKLTNKKHTTRSATHVEDQDTAGRDPGPMHPPASLPFGQHLMTNARPASPATNPHGGALMMPPPPPPASLSHASSHTFFAQAQAQARPTSRPILAHPAPIIPHNAIHNPSFSLSQPIQTHSGARHAHQSEYSPAPSHDEIEYRNEDMSDPPGTPAERRGSRSLPDVKRLAPQNETDPERPAKRLRVGGSVEPPRVRFEDGHRVSSPLPGIMNVTPEAHQHYQQQHQAHRRPMVPEQEEYLRQQQVDPLMSIFGGSNAPALAAAYQKKYEDEVYRWEKASMQEWEAHGLVLTKKFAEVLDTVKGHMMRKVQLYTSLKGVTQKHRLVLEQRENAIKAERDKLLKKVNGVGE
ncbi:hypothetical protein BKA62DRAFT_682112 [Auriculariales sp. MPI-PUGE-AT-0066]|nr:hypothetical protein BKA62DRAFT_682112 [Auriculariales sp. MPI-PUGE-AT-0066]